MSTAPDPTVSMVRSTVAWCLACAPVVALATWWWKGSTSVPSALGGLLVVTVFFAVGVLMVNTLTAAAPGLSVVGAYAVYATQLMLLLLVVVLARDYVTVDRPAFALGAIVGTMAWQVAHTVAFSRARLPIHTPRAPKEEP